MPIRNRNLAITLLILLIVVGFFRILVGQFVPDEDSDYVFNEIRVLTLDNKLLQIIYPVHLFPEKSVSPHSRIRFALLDQPASLPSPSANTSNCISSPVTVFPPTATPQALPPTSVQSIPQTPSSQPTPSTPNSKQYHFVLENPDRKVTFLDEDGNPVTREIIFTDDYNHSQEYVYLGTNNTELFLPQKDICIYIHGSDLAAPIPLAIDVDGNVFKYLNEIALALNWAIGIVFSLIIGFVPDYKKSGETESKKIDELRDSLEKSITAREWDSAYIVSKANWDNGEYYRKAISAAWKKKYEGIRNDVIEKIGLFVNADLQGVHLKQRDRRLNKAIDYILSSLKEHSSLRHAAIDFVINQDQQFIDRKIHELVIDFQNRFWLAFSDSWEKREIPDNSSLQETLSHLQIPNIFDLSACEHNYEQSINNFYVSRAVNDTVRQLFRSLHSYESSNLFVWKSERQGGRSTLGVWCLQKLFTKALDGKNELYFFPIYIKLSSNLTFDVIERQIAEHLLSYIVLNPEDYLNPNSRGASDAITYIIRNKFSLVEVKSRIETLAREYGSNKQKLDKLINIFENYKYESVERNAVERIKNISLGLPGFFQGLFLVIDFSDFTLHEQEFLNTLYSQMVDVKNISVLALIPILSGPVQFHVNHSEMELIYDAMDIAQILEYRLKYHQFSGSMESLLANLSNGHLHPKQFVSASQGKPGLSFQKGRELIELVANRPDDIVSDVYAMFYVPDQIFRVDGKKSIIGEEQQDFSSIGEFIQAINKLESVQFTEKGDWADDIELRVRSVYNINLYEGNPGLELFFYAIKHGFVRNQPKKIEKVRLDIIKNFSALENESLHHNKNVQDYSTTSPNLKILKKDRGVLVRMLQKDEKIPGRILLVYVDRKFDYMVAIKNIENSDEEKLIKIIDDFYDWI